LVKMYRDKKKELERVGTREKNITAKSKGPQNNQRKPAGRVKRWSERDTKRGKKKGKQQHRRPKSRDETKVIKNSRWSRQKKKDHKARATKYLSISHKPLFGKTTTERGKNAVPTTRGGGGRDETETDTGTTAK